MLPEAPCIVPLVGCSENTWTSGTTGNSLFGNNNDNFFSDRSSSSFSSTSSRSSSSRSSLFDSRSSSSSSRDSFFSRSASSSSSSLFTSRLSSRSERLSAYTVALRSTASEPENVTISHGPVPSGAVLDTTRTSEGCTQNDTSIQCTVQVPANGTRDVNIVYIVPNSTSCSLERRLQSVAVIGGSAKIKTSVSCQMKNEALAQASSSIPFSSSPSSTSISSSASSFNFVPSSSSFSSSFSSSAFSSSFASSSPPLSLSTATYTQVGASGALVQQYASGSTFLTQDTAIGMGKGKNYAPYPRPRTGAADILFQSHAKDYVLRTVRTQENSTMPSLTFVVALFFAAFAIVLFIRRQTRAYGSSI